MKLAWMTTAALALGVSSLIPTTAKADNWRNDRDARYDRGREVIRYERFDHDRFDRDDRNRDFDRDISLRDLPRDVMDTANYERHGLRIESVQFVHRDGKFFYRVRLDDPRPAERDVNLRIAPGGKLLTVLEAEQCDPGYFHGRR